MSDIKTKDIEQRKEYFNKLMKDETLLKAAMWLLVYKYKWYKRNNNIDWDLAPSDYHGIDIILKPELYETEIKPEIKEMIEKRPRGDKMTRIWKIFDSDDYIEELRKFLNKEKNIREGEDLRLYILERSYRAYASVNKLKINSDVNDWRENSILKKYRIKLSD